MNNQNTIDIRVTAQDLASKVLGNINKELGTFPNLAKKVSLGFGLIGGAAMGAGLKLAQAAGKYASVRDSFAGMTQGMGIDVAEFERRVAAATGGQLDNFTILEAATRSLGLIGRSAFNDFGTDFEKMAELSKKASRATGQDVNFMFDSLVLGIARESKMILDNLGINLDLVAAKERYAASIGKTTEQLTQSEQKTAVLNAAMQQLENTYGNVAVSAGGFSGVWQQLQTFIKNQSVEIGTVLQPAYTHLTKVLLDLGTKVLPVVIQGLKIVTSTVSSFVKNNQSAIATALKVVAVLGSFGASMFVASKIVLGLKAGILIATTALKIFTVQLTVTKLMTGILGIAMLALTASMARQVMKSMEVKDATKGVGDTMAATTPLVGELGDTMAKSFDKGSEALSNLRDALDEERRSFEEQLGGIVRNARERISNNKMMLSKEASDFEAAQDKKKSAHEEETEKIKAETAQRIQDLEESMKRSVVIGSSTYERDLANYQRAVEATRQEGTKRLANSEALYKEEMEKERKSYEERVNELQNKIKKDEEMLAKHAETIKGIKIGEQKDEITILKETHAKRLAELQAQYDKEAKMAKETADSIAKSFSDSAGLSSGAFSDAFDSIALDMPSMKDIVLGSVRSIATGLKLVWSFFDASIQTALGALLAYIGNVAARVAEAMGLKSLGERLRKTAAMDSKIADTQSLKALDAWNKIQSSASFAKGIDVVPNDMIAQIHKGEKVVPASQNPDNPDSFGGQPSGSTINNYFYNTEIDANALSSRLMFQLKTA